MSALREREAHSSHEGKIVERPNPKTDETSEITV